MTTRKLPKTFISQENLEYFKNQGGYEVLDEFEKVFGEAAVKYILNHTLILYDRISLSRTASGTCEQDSVRSIVRLRYNTVNSRAKAKWWKHVLKHEILHSLTADISLALYLSRDDSVAEGLPIILENLMGETPIPNSEDRMFAINTIDAIERLSKQHKLKTRDIISQMIGGVGSKSRRKVWGKEISREYKNVEIENKRRSSKDIYDQQIKRFVKTF